MIGAALESFRSMQDRLLGSDAVYRRGSKEFLIRVDTENGIFVRPIPGLFDDDTEEA